MATLHFLGTCSGTEPFPDMHHQSWILTVNGINYWFDAGENCAHMKEDGSNGWHSYSFLIETEGKRIVFSGDVASAEELLPLIGDGCDMLIMESGHHDVQSVFDFAANHNVQKLRMTHHGRQILENRQNYEEMAVQYTQSTATSICICYDGMTEEL